MLRFLRPETLFFLIALAVLLLVFRERGFNDPGTFWHTRVGEIIFADGFMTTDPFTFRFEGRTWIPQQWGGELLMALLDRIGGFDAMLLIFLAIFVAAFTGVFRRLLAGGMGWPLAGAVTAFAIVAAGFHFYVRPHIFTIAFMVLVTAFIVDYDAKRVTWKHLLWLIPLHIIWTNIHGGMLGGVASLGFAVASWIVIYSYKRRIPITLLKTAMLLIAIVVACVLTMFVNPIGLELQQTWFRLIGSQELAKNVPEHSPLDPDRGGDQAVLGFAALYIIILAAAGKPKRIWLLPLVWLALSITSIRNGPLFVATASVMLADIWPHTFWFRRLRASGDTLASQPVPLPPLTLSACVIPLAVVSLGLVLQHFRVPVPLLGSGWVRLDSMAYPKDMIEAVRDIPPGERIYNDPILGGFLIWNARDHKIFHDDRFELWPHGWLDGYASSITQPERLEAWRKFYNFRWAIIVPELTPVLEDYLDRSPAWKLVRKTKTAALYEYIARPKP